jgi:hypothetical protein
MDADKPLTTTAHAAKDSQFNSNFHLYRWCRIVATDTMVQIGGAVTRDRDGMVLEAYVIAEDGRSWLLPVDELDGFTER